MSTPLATRTDLDKLRCSVPDCEHDGPPGSITIEPTCCLPDVHAMWATYKHGELHLTCCRCGRHVISIAVAG
jgi:hypothetical protein